jgi:hypothetical protein
MGKKQFTLPFKKSHESEMKKDWGILKNKYSGKILFRSAYYPMVSGNLSVMEEINNRWFFEEIFSHASCTLDLNMLPALKRIASGRDFDEGLRQRSSEIIEKMEDSIKKSKDIGKLSTLRIENERINNTRNLLAGSRTPQAAEILRLLRDKYPELNKLALFLVGKFNMTEMIPEVCSCLAVPGIRSDACAVLESMGRAPARELGRFYLTSASNLSARKAALLILGKSCSEENAGFLLEIVLSNIRQLKEAALDGLINCGYKTGGKEKERLYKLIYETFGLLSWITDIKAGLFSYGRNELAREVDKEYMRWESFLYNLLTLTYGDLPNHSEGTANDEIDDDYGRMIYAMAKIVFGDNRIKDSQSFTDAKKEQGRQRKFQKYFPSSASSLKKIYDDLINCDYNLIGVWTKANAVRDIPGIVDDDIAESVVALLFSPEDLLQEEAARSIAGSGRELYNAAAERIPERARNKLESIVTGILEEKELMFEKVKFLSSCFPGIYEDELLTLGKGLIYKKEIPDQIPSSSDGSIIWCFSEGNALSGIFMLDNNSGKDIIDEIRRKGCSSCYVLNLDTLEEFRFLYPVSSWEVLRYIDNYEG